MDRLLVLRLLRHGCLSRWCFVPFHRRGPPPCGPPAPSSHRAGRILLAAAGPGAVELCPDHRAMFMHHVPTDADVKSPVWRKFFGNIFLRPVKKHHTSCEVVGPFWAVNSRNYRNSATPAGGAGVAELDNLTAVFGGLQTAAPPLHAWRGGRGVRFTAGVDSRLQANSRNSRNSATPAGGAVVGFCPGEPWGGSPRAAG